MITEHYIAANKDKSVLDESSSGGIFTALSQYIFENNGIVCGALFDSERKEVIHKVAYNIDEISTMRKSKYVWSDYTNCLLDLEKAIEDEKIILFTGTPCQCEIIRKKYGYYEGLYIVDVYCHGTGDKTIFKEYLQNCLPDCDKVDFRGEKANSEINYVFKAWNSENVQIIEEEYGENIYTFLYVNSVALRDSCFQCPFAVKKHVSDITIGDFEFKDIAYEYGITVSHPSIVSLNTIRGKQFWNYIQNSVHNVKLNNSEKQIIVHYFRDHKQLTGAWGYNKEIKEIFETNRRKYGFLKAAYMCLYPIEMRSLEEAQRRCWNNIYLYGHGKVGKRIKKIIDDVFSNINILGYIVTNKEVDYVLDIPVYSIVEIKNLKSNVQIIVSVAEHNKVGIYKELKKYGIKDYI